MFNRAFIFEECGFGWVPDSIRRDLLFNVSYDLESEEIKLYILDESKQFVYKVGQSGGITTQRNALKIGAPTKRLSEFLGADFDYDDVLLDTVEDNVYYVYIEESSPSQYNKFLNYLCLKYAISKDRFIEVVNRINKQAVANFYECGRRRAVSLVKVPFLTSSAKIYSRPFRTGNGFDLSANATAFLTRLYDCRAADLGQRLGYLWVSAELFSDRIVLSAQHHELLHRGSSCFTDQRHRRLLPT